MSESIQKPEKSREERVLAIAIVCTVIVCVLVAVTGFFLLEQPDEILEGQADATTVRVSGKLPGRVVNIYVSEGDTVHAGDTLAHVHSSLAEAKLMQAKAMEEVAAAQNSKVDAGTRPEIVAGTADLVAQAAAAREITRKTYERMNALFAKGVVSEQKRDEARAAYDAAVAAERAAKSQHDLAVAGAQRQDKESAAAMVTAARGGVGEVESLLEDQYLVAPCDGVVDQIYPEAGELLSIGAPVMSVLKTADKWVTFNVREELLSQLKPGKEIELMVPAFDGKNIKAKVYYVRDMGTYATWRATKATGEWDSRTFEVKARPVEPQPDLRPGMTVVYKLKK